MAQERGQSSLQHHRGSYVDDVNMENDTQCRICSGLVISVELAQTSLGAVGFFTAPAVHMCSSKGASDSARTMRAQEWVPIAGYVCSPH